MPEPESQGGGSKAKASSAPRIPQRAKASCFALCSVSAAAHGPDVHGLALTCDVSRPPRRAVGHPAGASAARIAPWGRDARAGRESLTLSRWRVSGAVSAVVFLSCRITVQYHGLQYA